MKIEEYELGQKVSLCGIIEEINIEDIYDKENTTTLSIKTVTGKIHVNPKWEEVKLDQPKPVVPQFVADWIEICDMRFVNLNYIFGENCPEKVKEWASVYGNHKKMLQALLYGYTVQKEKLYTVEIPNPNRNSKGCAKFRLEKLGDKVYLVKRKSKDVYQNKDSQKLTEAEIRKDFDWAWQQGFAKEVTE